MALTSGASLRQAISFIVRHSPGLGRVRLVKILYIADVAHYELYGHSLTGCTYIRDASGPNLPVVRDVTREMDGVELLIEPGKGPSGRDVIRHHPGPKLPEEVGLSPAAERVILFALAVTRGKELEDVIAMTKRTPPWIAAEKRQLPTGASLDFSVLTPLQQAPPRRALGVFARFASTYLSRDWPSPTEEYAREKLKLLEDLLPARGKANSLWLKEN